MRRFRISHPQFPLALCPRIRFSATDFPGQIHAHQAGKTACSLERSRFVRAGRDTTVLRTLGAQNTRQLARINPGDRHNVAGF